LARQLNTFAEEIPAPTITLPVFTMLQQPHDETEERIICIGREAWRSIDKVNSFKAWSDVGAALCIGKRRAQRMARQANNWRERNYYPEFSRWMRENGFGTMAKSVRSVCIELHENINAITRWRATLSEKQRNRLVHPLSNVRRWKAATMPEGKSPNDFKMEARAAWRRFLHCVSMLPPADQVAMWQMVHQTKIADAA
jgi:hypothetical protein